MEYKKKCGKNRGACIQIWHFVKAHAYLKEEYHCQALGPISNKHGPFLMETGFALGLNWHFNHRSLYFPRSLNGSLIFLETVKRQTFYSPKSNRALAPLFNFIYSRKEKSPTFSRRWGRTKVTRLCREPELALAPAPPRRTRSKMAWFVPFHTTMMIDDIETKFNWFNFIKVYDFRFHWL